MKKYIILICCAFLGIQVYSQTVSGVIKNDKGEFLYGATVKWEQATTGVVADINGYFELPAKEDTALLQIDYVGYESVFVEVVPGEDNLEIEVDGISELMMVEVAAKEYDNYVSTIQILNVETIGSGELRKAACCNLSETFLTNAAVW